MLFRSWIALTVVPNLAAIADNVSPDLTVYVCPADLVGVAVGRAVGAGVGLGGGDGLSFGATVGLGAGVGLATATAELLDPGLGLAASVPADGFRRATRTAPTAAIMAMARTAWPIVRRSATLGTGIGGRPRSMTTGVVRAIGRSGTSGTAAR